MNQVDENGPDEFVGREVLALSEEESRSFLHQIGYGVLAVADNDRSHAFPVSFGYDGESALYYQFGSEEQSRKMAFVEATERATHVIFNVHPPEWRSVIVEGPIERVPDEELESAYDAHKDNAWVPLNVFSKPLENVAFTFYRLDIENITGYGSNGLTESED